ncbi:hypothetical protein VUR80DRAFT_1466 [Thermomyces stellatus]
MVALCYCFACPISEDSGFSGRLRAVSEGAAGIDVDCLTCGLQDIACGNLLEQPGFKDPKQAKYIGI